VEHRIPIEKAVEIASEMHRAGQFQRAEAMYREILRQDPGNIDAIHLLGVLAMQGGRPDIAVELIGRAESRRPDSAMIQLNYAEALAAHGKREEAIGHYLKAIELEPEHYEAMNNLGKTYIELGKLQEAIDIEQRSVRVREVNPIAYNNMGNALRAAGRDAEAVGFYEKAAQQDTNFPEALNNLGLSLCSLGRIEEGMKRLREAVQLNPTLHEIHNNIGVVLMNLARPREAIKAFETALKLDPDYVDARNNLGSALRADFQFEESLKEIDAALEKKPESMAIQLNRISTLREMGRHEDALAMIEKCHEKAPDSDQLHFLKAMTFRDLGKPDEAIEAYRAALKAAPHRAEVMAALGYSLQERGELDEAMEMLKGSIERVADPQTHSNVMMVYCYHPAVTPAEHFEAHRGWARKHEEPLKPFWKPHVNTRDPERRIRVGYISPDLRGHVVSYFSNPIFENHDHSQFEIYAYSNHFHADATTILQRARIDKWREVVGMPWDKAAEMIRADEVDILVELAGHTAGNGLPVLAYKPAPIQINAIGFPSTTGLSAVDYRITDDRCDPEGMTDAYNSERLLRMPDCFWCYAPPDTAPEVGELPAERNGYVTLVSVNNFTKVTDQVLHTWAKGMSMAPKTKIVLQTAGLKSQFARDRVKGIFAQHGVGEDRIEMRTMVPFNEYLNVLNNSDIMLDPFPFNGGTTTCHGLWMGLPVVALEGRMHAGRMGYSMLKCIGLPELCAGSEEGYAEVLVGLAGDVPRLREIRRGMRERLRASPLLDGAGYVRTLEAAYRRIWREWCLKGE
jgi:predicted O-linked N-acetylglucosamine transferase (SPINDLY family)